MARLFSKKSRWVFLSLILFSSIIVLFTAAYLIALAHREEILKAITESFNENSNGKVEIEKLDFSLLERFPAFSVRVNGVIVTDSLIQVHRDTLFKAEQASFQLSIPSLLVNKIRLNSVKIEDASVRMLRTAGNYTNTTFNKKTEEKTGSRSAQIGRVFLKNVSFQYSDSLHRKFFSLNAINAEIRLLEGSDITTIKMETSFHSNHLIFNPLKGGYLTNKDVILDLEGKFSKKDASLIIDQAALHVDQREIILDGKFEFGKVSTMNLRFRAPSILPSVAYDVLPPLIASKLKTYMLQNPVMAVIYVKGSLVPGSKPEVDVFFKTTDNTLVLANRSIEKLELLGWFTTHVDSGKINDDHNSRVYLPVFRGTLNDLPLDAKLIVSDTKSPYLQMKATSNLIIDEKSNGIFSDRLAIYSGGTEVHFDYSGPMLNYVDSAEKKLRAVITGSASFSNFSFDYLPSGYQFRNVNGKVSFNQKDVAIESLTMEVNRNKAVINGTVTDFIPFLFVPGAVPDAELSLVADTLNLDLLRARDSIGQNQPSSKIKKKSHPAVSYINWMIDHLEVGINMQVNQLIYKRFHASEVKSRVAVAGDYLRCDECKMNFSKGTFTFTGSLTQLLKPVHELQIRASISGCDVEDIMYAFENFGQETISKENIEGVLNVNATFSTRMDKNFKVIPSTMQGELQVSIKDGALKDFESLSKISKYVFKNRDFTNIQFADLKNHYTLNGSQLNIINLDVYSSVMTFFVEGIYDFRKTNTDLLIRIPYSNLKKQDARISTADTSLKDNSGLVLKATYGEDGKLNIAPVVFGKKKRN